MPRGRNARASRSTIARSAAAYRSTGVSWTRSSSAACPRPTRRPRHGATRTRRSARRREADFSTICSTSEPSGIGAGATFGSLGRARLHRWKRSRSAPRSRIELHRSFAVPRAAAGTSRPHEHTEATERIRDGSAGSCRSRGSRHGQDNHHVARAALFRPPGDRARRRARRRLRDHLPRRRDARTGDRERRHRVPPRGNGRGPRAKADSASRRRARGLHRVHDDPGRRHVRTPPDALASGDAAPAAASGNHRTGSGAAARAPADVPGAVLRAPGAGADRTDPRGKRSPSARPSSKRRSPPWSDSSPCSSTSS